MVELLLEYGATHALSSQGRSPLDLAASLGRYDIATVLLQNGATHDADYVARHR